MINTNTQDTLMNSAMHFNVYHVFQSSVKFDMFIVTSLGVLQYDTFSYTWEATDMKTREDILEKYKHKPIYSHGQIVDNLMFWKKNTVNSLTNVSYEDL